MWKRRWLFGGMMTCLLALPAAGIQAQSVKDAIKQLLLDVQKLSGMKQMLSRMYDEYTMLEKGYENIKGLSQGTFSLHQTFLDGLLRVSPFVSGDPRVTNILQNQAAIIKNCGTAMGYFRSSGRFTSQELDGFLSGYGVILQRVKKNMDELSMVLTDGELRMSDDERLSAIDRIDDDMSGQMRSLQAFNNSAAVQVMQRARTEVDIGVLRELLGVQR